MLEGAMIVWFALAIPSVLFVVYDSFTNGVTSWVQRLAWILVTVYAGPVALVFYLLGCRRPFPGAHDAFTKATWKQGLNSEMHCLAGDATGIAIAAAIVSTLELTNGWDAVVEYAGGFLVGLFVFQALMMRGMYQGRYGLAVRKTLFAETLSMNFVMTGMIPVMVVLAREWPQSMDPLTPEFWFRMSIAAVVGGVLAYPVNHWLVASHLKHGCMTLPNADGPAPLLGLVALDTPVPALVGAGEHPEMSMEGDHGEPMSAADHAAMGTGEHEGMEGEGHEGMQMSSLPLSRATTLVAVSFVILFVAVWLTGRFVPITF